jgi:hypothetical protein
MLFLLKTLFPREGVSWHVFLELKSDCVVTKLILSKLFSVYISHSFSMYFGPKRLK